MQRGSVEVSSRISVLFAILTYAILLCSCSALALLSLSDQPDSAISVIVATLVTNLLSMISR